VGETDRLTEVLPFDRIGREQLGHVLPSRALSLKDIDAPRVRDAVVAMVELTYGESAAITGDGTPDAEVVTGLTIGWRECVHIALRLNQCRTK
jgi:hypothetical protein